VAKDRLAKLTLNAAGRLSAVTVDGKPTSVATISRWASRGRLTPDGQRVKLHVERVGGRVTTTAADIDEFLRRLNGETKPTPAEHELADVDAELERMGV